MIWKNQCVVHDRINLDRIRKFLKFQTVRRYKCRKTGEEKIAYILELDVKIHFPSVYKGAPSYT